MHTHPQARVEVSDDTLSVELSDGRAIAVPLVWFPRLFMEPLRSETTGD